MVASGINKGNIARMMRDMQKEFDKHPIKVPLEADGEAVGPPTTSGHGPTIYNGPVIHGDATGAQLAWGNQTVYQSSERTEEIAAGFEAIAQAVARTLEQLNGAGLSDEEVEDARAAGDGVLVEVTKEEPDRRVIRRGVAALRGFLAPVAMGLAAGGADGAHEWAKTAVEQLGTSF